MDELKVRQEVKLTVTKYRSMADFEANKPYGEVISIIRDPQEGR